MPVVTPSLEVYHTAEPADKEHMDHTSVKRQSVQVERVSVSNFGVFLFKSVFGHFQWYQRRAMRTAPRKILPRLTKHEFPDLAVLEQSWKLVSTLLPSYFSLLPHLDKTVGARVAFSTTV